MRHEKGIPRVVQEGGGEIALCDGPLPDVAEALVQSTLTLAVAESCTGGLLGAQLTASAGSSRYFLGGFITYDNRLKEILLKVGPSVLRAHGAVSPQAALSMAEGARMVASADIAVSVTGIAGPGGATADKPVGTTFVALAAHDTSLVRAHRFDGGREHNRQAAVRAALALICDYLSDIRRVALESP